MDRIQAMQMFMRVAEAGSFVRAAETLSLPASTVTSTIKNLEKYLKVRLLNRTTRRVSLTRKGCSIWRSAGKFSPSSNIVNPP